MAENIDNLEEILKVQKASQEYRGFTFPMQGANKAAYIKTQTLHCIDELCEMLHEVKGYKEWKRYDYYDEFSNKVADTKATEEFIDALHFFVNIALAFGLSADDIFNKYMTKQMVNQARLEDTKEYKKDTEE